MKYKVLSYSLKVWLTSVGAAPFLILLIFMLWEQTHKGDTWPHLINWLWLYAALALVELIFSAPVWLIFIGFISLILWLPARESKKKWLIFICGIVLTVTAFMAVLVLAYDLHDYLNPIFLAPMACNCLCIGWGIWLYNPFPATRAASMITHNNSAREHHP